MSRLKPVWWKVFWVMFVLTMGVYLAMVLWSLPELSAMADGLAMFDLRPLGYGFEEARNLVVALGPDGRAFYLNVQQTLDTAYPAMLAIATVMALVGLDRGGWGWVFAVFSVAGTIFDYLENAYVKKILEAGPVGLTPELVEQASSWTLLKSISHTIAFTGLLILCLNAAFCRFRSSRNSMREAKQNLHQREETDT